MRLTWSDVIFFGLFIGIVLAFVAYIALTIIGSNLEAEARSECLKERGKSQLIISWDEKEHECVRHERPQWIEQDV
jgi:hypothetical protein